MLNVTTAARDCLLSRLGRKKAPDGVAMRFTRKKSGWKLRMDQQRPEDTAFEHKGRNVLLLDEDISRAMATMTLDVKRTDTGVRLKLQRIKNGSA